jgi:hypothetical protein
VLENVGATTLIRKSHPDDLVETPWAAKCRIDVLGTVGSGKHEDLTGSLEHRTG